MDDATLGTLTPAVTVPPNKGFLVVPASDRKTLGACLTIFSASSPRAVLLQRLSRVAVLMFGTSAYRSSRTSWSPPVPADRWSQLLDVWRAVVGPFDTFAVYERPQPDRPGMSVIPILEGRPTSVIRVRVGRYDFSTEAAVLTALGGAAGGVRTPRLLRTSHTAGCSWLAMSYATHSAHRPANRPPYRDLDAALHEKLSLVLPRRPDTPGHWRPMHGDLVPWNLRRDGRGVFLLDWEDCAWAPPHADYVYHRATLGLGPNSKALAGPEYDEARKFWIAAIRHRNPGDDPGLHARQLRSLIH